MNNNRPTVTVVYQDAAPSAPGFGAVFVEVIVFLALMGGVALIAGGGCMMWMW